MQNTIVVYKFLSLFKLFVGSLLGIEPVPDTITTETRPAIAAEGFYLLRTSHLSHLLMMTFVQALITTLPQLVPSHIFPKSLEHKHKSEKYIPK